MNFEFHPVHAGQAFILCSFCEADDSALNIGLVFMGRS